MPGIRFFSIFALILASLFIQKSFDVSFLLEGEESISSANKLPSIQLSVDVAKVTPKQKSQKTFFIPFKTADFAQDLLNFSEKFCSSSSYFPKPSFENPSRAPPVG
jgi:hypothetical protein